MSLRSRLRALLTMGQGVVLGLPDADAGQDPIVLFGRWFDDARRSGLLLPEAMCLATATPDGRPSARMMLLKGADQRGFVFFTNYESRKGDELAANARAALVFHWAVLQRQVRVEGTVQRLSADESYKGRVVEDSVVFDAQPFSAAIPDLGPQEVEIQVEFADLSKDDLPSRAAPDRARRPGAKAVTRVDLLRASNLAPLLPVPAFAGTGRSGNPAA